MSYIVRVNGMIVGAEVLTAEEVRALNNKPEISLEKIEK